MRKNRKSLSLIKPHTLRRRALFTTRVRRSWYDLTWIYDHWYM